MGHSYEKMVGVIIHICPQFKQNSVELRNKYHLKYSSIFKRHNWIKTGNAFYFKYLHLISDNIQLEFPDHKKERNEQNDHNALALEVDPGDLCKPPQPVYHHY